MRTWAGRLLEWWRRLPWDSLRPWAWAIIVGIVAAGMWRVETTARQAHDAVTRQTETRVLVLCPLYEVFLASDTPQRRAATPPEDLDRYEHAIAVVRGGAETLDCAFLEE